MFIIVSSFTFGCCIGYYSFEFVKSRNPKYQINDFILSYNRKNGIQHRVFDKKIGRSENLMIVFLVMICLMKKNFSIKHKKN